MGFFLRNLKYLFQVNLKDLKRAKAAGGLVNSRQLEEFMDNWKYELHDELKTLWVPKIKTIDETISLLAASKASLCRFGDGEFWLMKDRGDIPFQKASPLLVKRLVEVISSSNPNIFIAIPRILYFSQNGIREKDRRYWRKNGKVIREQIAQYIEPGSEGQYYAAEVSIAYSIYDDFYDAEAYFNSMRGLWHQRDVAIVCGNSVFDNLERNIFDNCKSVEYLYAPAVNAFERYDAILDEARKIDKKKLVIAILGPTATVLAYDLGRIGYQALDLGHIAKSYDWYLRGKTRDNSTDGVNFFSPD